MVKSSNETILVYNSRDCFVQSKALFFLVSAFFPPLQPLRVSQYIGHPLTSPISNESMK